MKPKFEKMKKIKPLQLKDFKEIETENSKQKITLDKTEKINKPGVNMELMKKKKDSLTWKSILAGVIVLLVGFGLKLILPESLVNDLLPYLEELIFGLFGLSVAGALWGIRRSKGDIK